MLRFTTRLLTVLSLSLLFAACTSDKKQDYPGENTGDKSYLQRLKDLKGGDATLFGDLTIGGPPKRENGTGQGGGVAVNLFLWEATLQTLSVGPLDSADPFGGVIITDWFTLNEDPDNQYRATAYILGRTLRADNIRVALYVRSKKDGHIVTKRGTHAAEQKLENLILSKARNIRATKYR